VDRPEASGRGRREDGTMGPAELKHRSWRRAAMAGIDRYAHTGGIPCCKHYERTHAE